jgi:hypothetical protein
MSRVLHPPPWPVLIVLACVGGAHYAALGFWRWITAPRHWEFASFTLRRWAREWRARP